MSANCSQRLRSPLLALPTAHQLPTARRRPGRWLSGSRGSIRGPARALKLRKLSESRCGKPRKCNSPCLDSKARAPDPWRVGQQTHYAAQMLPGCLHLLNSRLSPWYTVSRDVGCLLPICSAPLLIRAAIVRGLRSKWHMAGTGTPCTD